MAVRFLLIIGGLLGVCQGVNAAEYTGDCGANGNNVTYSLNTTTGDLTISGTGVMKNWSSANNVPWYNYRTSVTSVTIGDNVTTIGQFAFYGCTALTSVSISSSVTTIANGAFSYCSSLTSIIIPNSVTGIAPAFTHCPVLTDIYVSWTTTDALPFWYSMTDKTPSTIKLHVPCSTTAQYQAKNGWKDYTIVEDRAFGPCGANGYNLIWSLSCGGTLTIKGSGAMYNWAQPNDRPWASLYSYIQHIIIENGVTSIGNHAFYSCPNLTSVSLPSTLTGFGWMAFWGCSQLTSLTIPSSVTGIGARSMQGCSSLAEINVSWTENIPAWDRVTDKSPQSNIALHIPCGTKSLYEGKTGWQNYTLDDGSVSGTCGATGSNLTWSLSCDSVMTISGTGEMADWSSSVYTPWDAYRGKIKHIVIEDGVTSIGNNAFSNLLNVTSLSIGSDVTSIGENAFYHCPLLEQVVIPDNVQTIGKLAFCNCSGVTTLTLGTGMTTIGQYAFAGCASLTSITIPDNVQTLGKYAFTGCTNVTTITIGTGVNTIEDYIFASMPNITDMYVGWTTADAIPAWSTGFTQVSPQSDITLHVPCSAMELYQAATGWKDYTIEGEGSYTITVTTDDASMGSVSITEL